MDAGRRAELRGRALRMRENGDSIGRIARILHVSWTTARRWSDANWTPKKSNPRPNPRYYFGPEAESFPVNPRVALLRDELVAAFQRGDMDAHARLCQQMRELLPRAHPREKRPLLQLDYATRVRFAEKRAVLTTTT